MLTRALLALLLFSCAIWPAVGEDTKVVALGVADRIVTEAELAGGAVVAVPRFNTPGIAYALLANAKKGDTVHVELKQGDKSLMHNVETLGEDKAQFLLLAGKRGVPAGGWPEGKGYASPELDALIDTAGAELSSVVRDALIEQVWRRVLPDVSVVPLYRRKFLVGVRDWLEVPVNPGGTPYFTEARLRRGG